MPSNAASAVIFSVSRVMVRLVSVIASPTRVNHFAELSAQGK